VMAAMVRLMGAEAAAIERAQADARRAARG
jgi:hypothetical protein